MLLQISEPKNKTSQPQSLPKSQFSIGIDLGTSNCVVAIAKAYDDVQVLAIEGCNLTPSQVGFKACDNSAVCGMAAIESSSLFQSFKRQMNHPALEIVSQNGKVLKTPFELSSLLLQYLKTEAEKSLGHSVDNAVITVPAFFDETARQATKDAAKAAGLNVLRLISEPTAAALSYKLDQGEEGLYVVYDLGGGTFDFSLLDMQKGVFQVLATSGDTQLGGNDMDLAIVEYWKSQGHLTQVSFYDALAIAKQVKEALSQQAEIHTPLFLSQIEFGHLITPLLDKTLQIVASVLKDAQKTIEDIKGVILVGGPTRIPYLRARVEDFFKRPPLTHLDPDEIVAKGAAMQAYMLTKQEGTLLLDVTPLSLGIETFGGLVEKIIDRNSAIPMKVSQEFTTYAHNQTSISLHVVQGEGELAKDCRSLAKFELLNIPPMPAGQPRIRVVFTLDADGLLSVTAIEKTTGSFQEIKVKPTYGLNEQVLFEILEKSLINGAQDLQKRQEIELHIKANSLIAHTESALKSDGDLLLSSLEKNEITRLITVLKKILVNPESSIDIVREATDELKRGTQEFARKRVELALQQASVSSEKSVKS